MIQMRAVLAASFLVLAAVSSADAPRPLPTWAPLPTDSAITVSVGLRAAWESHIDGRLLARSRTIATEVAAYPPDAAPDVKAFYSHQITYVTPPRVRRWYRAAPIGDTVGLAVRITDSRGRLGVVSVTDPQKGTAYGGLGASRDGKLIQGRVTVPWGHPFYLLDLYAKDGRLLARLVASDGGMNRVVHFKVLGYFAPKRPECVSSPRFGVGETGSGPVGNAWDLRGVPILPTPDGQFSVVTAAADGSNDSGYPLSLLPPLALEMLPKESRLAAGWFSYPPVHPILSAEYLAEYARSNDIGSPEWSARAITMPPFTTCTGYWRVRLRGTMTAYFEVPYGVTRCTAIYDRLQQVVRDLASRQHDCFLWAIATWQGYREWLKTPEGVQSGLDADMLGIGTCITAISTEADEQRLAIQEPMLDAVTFSLPAEAVAADGVQMGRAVAIPSPWAPEKPVPEISVPIEFAPGCTTVTHLFPKGHSFAVVGTSNPADRTDIMRCLQVMTPCKEAVSMQWLVHSDVAIATVDKDGRPIEADVTVRDAQGKLLYEGRTRRSGGGCRLRTLMLPVGLCTIEASAPPLKGSATCDVPYGLHHEVQVVLTPAK